MSLVSQGKCLIDDVSKAVSLLREGNQKQATRDLGLLKVRAQQLCAETLKLARQLEMEREHYKTAVEEATRMLGDLTCKKNRLAQDLKVAKHELQTKEVELSNLEKQLDLAKRNLCIAIKEKNAAEESKNAMIGTTIGVGVAGVLFSVATLGIGAPVAVAATTACGVSAAKYAEKEDEARRSATSYEERISTVNDSIRQCELKIYHYEEEIRNLDMKVEEQARICKEKQIEKEGIHIAISFLQEAQHFWNRLSDALQDRTDQTHRLHQLLDKAEERKDWNFLQKQGTHTKVRSFIEAWECLQEEIGFGPKYLAYK